MEAGRPRVAAKRCCTTSPRSPVCTSRRCTTSSTTVPRSAPSRPAIADVPAVGRQAHGRRSRRVAVPEEPARAARRSRARPPERRDLPRVHPRLPLLPGRDDHPARCGSGPRSRSARMVRDGLRRTGYDEVALTSLSSADFSGIDGVVADLVRDQDGHRRGQRLVAVVCGSTRSASASRARSRRSVAPASRSRPRPGRGGCARSSTSSSWKTTCTPPSTPPTRRAGGG